MTKAKNQGFTLIELLVVIAIIGILAAVVLVSLNSARAKSRDAKRVADVRQVMTALELFYNDNGSYPDESPAGSILTTDGASGATFADFLKTFPTAPTPEDGSCTPSNNTYVYAGRNAADSAADTTDPAFYRLNFCLGGPTGGLSAGAHFGSPAGLQ